MYVCVWGGGGGGREFLPDLLNYMILKIGHHKEF